MVLTRDNPIAQRILESAARLFAHKGYAATSTREIVEAAHVTKPMLYYYFTSKEGLCRAVLEQFRDQFQARLRRVPEEGRPPLEQLVEVVWAHLDYCQAHKDIARLFLALYFGPAEETAELNLEEYAGAGQDVVMQVVKHAHRSGLIRPRSQPAFLLALHGQIHIWVIHCLKNDVELSRKVARQIVTDLIEGFGRKG